jgi:hypothetical protein
MGQVQLTFEGTEECFDSGELDIMSFPESDRPDYSATGRHIDEPDAA